MDSRSYSVPAFLRIRIPMPLAGSRDRLEVASLQQTWEVPTTQVEIPADDVVKCERCGEFGVARSGGSRSLPNDPPRQIWAMTSIRKLIRFTAMERHRDWRRGQDE